MYEPILYTINSTRILSTNNNKLVVYRMRISDYSAGIMGNKIEDKQASITTNNIKTPLIDQITYNDLNKYIK